MSTTDTTSPHAHWAAAASKIAIVSILAGACLVIYHCRPNKPNLASADQLHLNGGTTLIGTQRLQLTTMKQDCTFERKDLGGPFLPDIVVSATAPVEFTYYIPLNDRWGFALEQQLLYVLAPAIEFNTPAIDASIIIYKTSDGSPFRNGGKAQERLKQEITTLVAKTAEQNIPVVRESCRHQTEVFVHDWVVKNFTNGSNFVIKAYFPDEALPPALQGKVKAVKP